MKRLIPVLLIGLLVVAGVVLAQANTPPPDTVTIAGTIQSVLGCDGDWQPECEATFLTRDFANDVWSATFELPEGAYEYKAALNGSWDENYGLHAEPGGANIPLVLDETTAVTFYYDHKTHWITDNVNSIIATLPGTHQSELGCVPAANTGDWEPGCLRTWLQDPDGDGIYTYSTVLIPVGDWEVKVAINGGWDENYGDEGARNGPNILYTTPADGHDVTFTWDSESKVLEIGMSDEPVVSADELAELRAALSASVPPPGDITKAKAYWVAADTIAWDIEPEVAVYRLHYDPDGAMAFEEGALVGGESIRLRFELDGLSEDILAKFPHMEGLTAFKIKEEDLDKVPDILKGQFAISATRSGGALIDATSLQIPGVLDDLYTYDGDLGVTYDGDTPTLKVWAPTARSVTLHLFDNPRPETESVTYDMAFDPATGVWSVTGTPDWTYKYYLYEVEVFVMSTGRVEHNLVTDPYSVSLSTNSQRSQIVDIFNDTSLMPPGWDTLEKPALDAPEDIVLYELHVRDFSSRDDTVPDGFRGTFMAFTVPESNGMLHLKDLADAGLTHVHLLPSFDIATINEDKSTWVQPDWDTLADLPPDSEEQQAALSPDRDADAFNWGYDPYHYTVPEGSYATNPNGSTRILQFRRMVQSLNEAGLRVVMDVVYNHTNACYQDAKSVMDKIVPGYYYRLNDRGAVETSSCCPNTATENNMMRKLMVDSVLTWAKAYKVDGFRYDLMGLHMVNDMKTVREAVDALTPEADGVDGTKVYIYGEGWNFGELANNARGLSATQLDVGGLGIGTFNDRIRDAVKGVTPFSPKQQQGFINGLYYDSNEFMNGTATEEQQKASLLAGMDQIRVGLAGNLRDYLLENAEGDVVTGADIPYNGQPTGYTLDPSEHICYISVHDNETLFDVIQYAAPVSATIDDRVRMQNMGISIVSMCQGVAFYHAGVDMLRSKSGDQDSYNSGDWFNALDFTYQRTRWGVGLPPAEKNQGNWDLIRPLLANPDLAPTPDHITQTVVHTQEMLEIRKSSPLFRLRTADDIQDRVIFHNTGPDQIPGLIVMSITDMGDVDNLDPNYQMIVVLFNATPETISFTVDDLAEMGFDLHPIQAVSADPVVQTASFEAGTFSVPGRTTAVFVLPE
ncbi:MAG: pullulanase-type alpha-1,6-glucosidase [Anaerolineae bacterium]|nr:pullulanase-type alpha-1,6-glucosidase [Anaerolineae bacterium]